MNWLSRLVFLLLMVGSVSQANEREIAWGPHSPGKDKDKAQKALEVKSSGDWGALAAFGEAGFRNFRGSATYGVYFSPLQRFKMTGEYLIQELDFNFKSKHQSKWVSQYAIGGQYQFLFNSSRFQSLDLGTAYNHAFSHKLESKTTSTQFAERRVAGSNGALSFIGTTVRLWSCGFLALALDYDWVEFNRTYESKKLSHGFGGSANLTQRFAKDFSLNLGAEFRQPFNVYQGLLNWNHHFSSFSLNLGLFGNLTYGHDKVRTIKTGGIQVGFSFGPHGKKCGRDLKLSAPGKECYARQYCDVSEWVATPAVYVPVVLAIADEKLTTINGCDISSTNPGRQFVTGANPLALLPTYIHSLLPVTYTFSQDIPADISNSLNFDLVTGVLTAFYGNDVPQDITVTVTATSSCGSTTQTFVVQFGP